MASLSTSRKPEPGAFRERRAVIVVDPLPVVRAGLSMLLASRPGFEVVAGVGTAADALAALEGVPSACVLVGLGLEGPNDAYWLTETIRDRFPNATVIALGSRSDTMTISRALLSGAGAFVDKTVEPDEFLDSMDLAVAGEMVLAGPPSEWVGAIAGALDRGDRPHGPLTFRERQVLSVASEGLTSREIADRLGVRERTVTTHLSRIYGKLGVRSRVAALRAATTAGLISGLDPE
jgi:DNA-binding NarL/FixJ family response regulator